MNVSPSHAFTVPTHVRDELHKLAASEGRTVDEMIRRLWDKHLWRRDVEEAKRAMRSASQEVGDKYVREVREWDATLMDGLGDYPWANGHLRD